MVYAFGSGIVAGCMHLLLCDSTSRRGRYLLAGRPEMEPMVTRKGTNTQSLTFNLFRSAYPTCAATTLIEEEVDRCDKSKEISKSYQVSFLIVLLLPHELESSVYYLIIYHKSPLHAIKRLLLVSM